MKILKFIGVSVLLVFLPTIIFAQTNVTAAGSVAAPVINNGDTAWMIVATALVLMMTIPGLALFYGGLVRRKNVLSVLMQCFIITSVISIEWVAFGYSNAFGSSHGVFAPYIGGFDWAFLKGIHINDLSPYFISHSQPTGKIVNGVPEMIGTIPHIVFILFQCMFAVITPALIIGAFAERIKFRGFLFFTILWAIFVYNPIAHWVWSTDGWLARLGALDFAGGTVVHMSSGWSGLVLCIILGKRVGFGKENMAPHSLVMTFIGASMLWVGWYGFNSGSAVAADVIAANAFTTTTIATAVGSFVWPMWDWVIKGKPTVLGFCSGAVAGLVLITPACGYVLPSGAIWIGIAAGTIPWFFCYKVKHWLGMDDALDVWSVHGIGGMTGAIMTGMFARTAANPNFALNLNNASLHPKVPAYVTDTIFQPQLWEQLKTVGVSLVLFIVGTIVIAYITKLLVGLRVTEEVEVAGLDINEHGEEGYVG